MVQEDLVMASVLVWRALSTLQAASQFCCYPDPDPHSMLVGRLPIKMMSTVRSSKTLHNLPFDCRSKRIGPGMLRW